MVSEAPVCLTASFWSPRGRTRSCALDQAQAENIATVRANVLIQGMAPETGVPLERVRLKPGGWGPPG